MNWGDLRSDPLYDVALLLVVAGFLIHVVVAVFVGGGAGQGVVLWPVLVGFCLFGGRWAGRLAAVSFVTISLIIAASCAVGTSCAAALSATIAGTVSFIAMERAERFVVGEILRESDKSARCATRLRQLEAHQRRLLEQSAKVVIGTEDSAGGRSRFGRRSLSRQREIYRFVKGLVAGILQARTIQGVAKLWRVVAKELAVERGLILVVDEDGLLYVEDAWGGDFPQASFEDGLSPAGRGIVEWVLEQEAIVEEHDAMARPQLKKLFDSFAESYFRPRLIVPVSGKTRPVIVLFFGEQHTRAHLELTPTLISPLLDIQQEIIDLILHGEPPVNGDFSFVNDERSSTTS